MGLGSDQMMLEIKETLKGDVETFPCRALVKTRTEVVVLFELSCARQVEDVTLPVGTLSFGYFWTDRGYNAYHWVTPSGSTLGIYFNISDSTRIGPSEVRWRDLAVDILVTPDGRCRVIDEDEIPADLDPGLVKKIRDIRDSIVYHHSQLIQEIEKRTAGLWGKHTRSLGT